MDCTGRNPRGTAALEQLPGELLNHIISFLSIGRQDDARNMNSLAQTCRRLYDVANPLLYRHNNRFSGNSAFSWAATRNIPGIFLRAWYMGVEIADQELPLLHDAVADGNVEVLDAMLSLGTLSNFKWLHKLPSYDYYNDEEDGRGEWITPFTVDINRASDERHAQCIRLLLQAGADPNKSTRYGHTPLHHAVLEGNVHAIAVLLDAGANTLAARHLVSSTSSSPIQGTPLHAAVLYGHFEASELLMARGPEIMTRGHGDCTCSLTGLAKAAVTSGDLDLLRLVLENFPREDGLKSKALMYALDDAIECGCRNEQVFDLLLDHGAGLETRKPSEDLLWKAAHGVLRVLVRRCGYNVNETFLDNERGFSTLLKRAAYGNDFEQVRILFELGANVNIPENGDVIRFVPHSRGHTSSVSPMLDVLLWAGARIDIAGRDGKTPLQYFTNEGCLRLVQRLIDLGAPITPYGDKTLLHLACLAPDHYVADYLFENHRGQCGHMEQCDLQGNTPLLAAAAKGQMEPLKWLIIKDANRDAVNSAGWDALTCAIVNGQYEVVKLLLHVLKMDPSGQDIDGRTALHHCLIRNSSSSNMDVLLNYNGLTPVHVKTKDKYGSTPLTIAARKGNAYAVNRILRYYSHDPHEILHRDIWGQTVWHWAARGNQPALMNVLHRHQIPRPTDAVDGVEDEDRGVADCFCNVCGRNSTSPPWENASECISCGIGDQKMYICSGCKSQGAQCRDPEHIWISHECDCDGYLRNGHLEEDDENSENSEEEEEYVDDGGEEVMRDDSYHDHDCTDVGTLFGR